MSIWSSFEGTISTHISESFSLNKSFNEFREQSYLEGGKLNINGQVREFNYITSKVNGRFVGEGIDAVSIVEEWLKLLPVSTRTDLVVTTRILK